MLLTIDNFLNKITMYRLVLYYLTGLFFIALLFAIFGILPYSPVALVYSLIVLLMACVLTNTLFARVFAVEANVESTYITAFILALIISPVAVSDIHGGLFLVSAAVIAMASKFVFAIDRKHIFNPAAFAVAITAATMGNSASWWVGGNIPMILFVVIGGVLVVRKIRHVDLMVAFFVAALVSVALFARAGADPLLSMQKALTHSPILFLAFVMLTEPLTTPPTRKLRILYAGLVGLLYSPAVHLASIYSTPELALLVGNIFSYCVSPKGKLLLRLKEIKSIAFGTQEYVFDAPTIPEFKSGQYMEWTLGQAHIDSRGNRRYFTIASSPTEPTIRLGVRMYPNASTFKSTLATLSPGDTLIAGQLAGDFVLPEDKKQKLVFIAGGIGVTPFRSMIKYMLDTNEKRTITLMYSNKTASEIAYKELFEEAAEKLGIKNVYTLTDEIPKDWSGRTGFISRTMIEEEVQDHLESMFYISGPQAMVATFEKTLSEMGIPKSHIKTDFFPGFA